jgi:hypothetical protein
MANEGAATPSSYPSAKVLDAVFLRETHEELGEALRRAKHEVSYFRGEICALATEPELPAAFRGAYGRVVVLLDAVEQAIIAAEKECCALTGEALSSGILDLEQSELNTPPDLAEAAKDVIAQINEAEVRLTNVVKSAKRALLDHAEQGLIDWSMPYNCEFTVRFNPGPRRRFYETCGEGEEPMRVRVRPRFRDLADDSSCTNGTYNWNVFEGKEDHPLRDGHHGYLVHCLFDHNHLPWQLLPQIQEIEVEFTFNDFETAWVAPIRSPPGCL